MRDRKLSSLVTNRPRNAKDEERVQQLFERLARLASITMHDLVEENTQLRAENADLRCRRDGGEQSIAPSFNTKRRRAEPPTGVVVSIGTG